MTRKATVPENGSGNPTQWLLDDWEPARSFDGTLHFRDFLEVSNAFIDGYSRLARIGFPNQMIGIAMLGATVNLFDILGMKQDLPDLLHSLAEKLESE